MSKVKIKLEKCPRCNRSDCLAYTQGHCVALSKNDFGTKGCPFFKTKEQAEADRAARDERARKIKEVESC